MVSSIFYLLESYMHGTIHTMVPIHYPEIKETVPHIDIDGYILKTFGEVARSSPQSIIKNN